MGESSGLETTHVWLASRVAESKPGAPDPFEAAEEARKAAETAGHAATNRSRLRLHTQKEIDTLRRSAVMAISAEAKVLDACRWWYEENGWKKETDETRAAYKAVNDALTQL